MNKALLLSVKPKWVAKILNGDKTIEVRKRFPKDYKGWVYIYATKQGFIYWLKHLLKWAFSKNYCKGGINGKVVARFYCDKVEEISYNYRGDYTSVYTDTLDTEDLEKQACLTRYEFADYLNTYYGYAIHISQLEIFDKLKELSKFVYICQVDNCNKCNRYCREDKDGYCNAIRKPPQSWCYCLEVEE